jgi:integrase/recombinase XerD
MRMSDIDLIDQYTAHQHVRGFSRRTTDRRAWSLGLWLDFLTIHDAQLATATVEQLETFLARWPSPQSRYSVRSDIHMLCFFAKRRGLLDNDPTELLDAPKIPRRRSTPVPAADVRRLLSNATAADRLAVLLAAWAGLRISEIAAVRGEHVDLDGRWLTVTGKGGRTDVIPLAAPLAAELANWPRHGRLLPYRDGPAVGCRLRALMRRLGIEARPHDLRHSFANAAMASSHDNVVVVQRLMRHSEIATTMRYVRPEPVAHQVVDALYGDAA